MFPCRVEIPFVFQMAQSGLIHGLAFWFDVAFVGSLYVSSPCFTYSIPYCPLQFVIITLMLLKINFSNNNTGFYVFQKKISTDITFRF